MSLLSKESYLHRSAKWVLKSWLKDEYQVISEMKLGEGSWKFIPDLTIFKNGFIQGFYEVTYLHPIDAIKLAKMQYYCYLNNTELLLHEVDAEWILRQTEKPDRIVNFTFDLSLNEQYDRKTD